MPLPNRASPASMLGGVSARTTRTRPSIGHDHAPPVRDALLGLLRDVDAVRGEAAQLRRPAADAAAPAQKSCLGRDAFVRELARIVSFVERYAVPASVIYLQVDRLSDIAGRLGTETAEAALAKVSETLCGQVRDTDFVGRVSDGGFGIILAKATRAEAMAKAEMLSELVKASPIVRNGRAVQLSVTSGAHAL
ncbi:MAG: diguanylate cyclase [Alphaproteobacteria bacterium]|nr:diguanylate cyclase [Alphaproteobacteria bacterium]